jgi:hypothetical protein
MASPELPQLVNSAATMARDMNGTGRKIMLRGSKNREEYEEDGGALERVSFQMCRI